MFNLPQKKINPYQILRFDTPLINDLTTLLTKNEEVLLVTACSDPFLRVYSLSENKVVKTIKSYYGNPLCLDLN